MEKYDHFKSDNKHNILRFSEYRGGSFEYGQILQDLMMLLRFKKNDNEDYIILKNNDFKNFDKNKLFKLLSNKKLMKSLGITFEVELFDDHIKFFNLGNKKSRHWENLNI